jgi:hypothetical protein
MGSLIFARPHLFLFFVGEASPELFKFCVA